MISSGSFGVLLVLSTLLTIVPATLSRSVAFPLDPDEITDSIRGAISHSLNEYSNRTAKQPYQAALLVAMTIQDLYSNGSSVTTDAHKWKTVVNWLQACGVLQNSSYILHLKPSSNLNLTSYIKQDHEFTVLDRSDKFGNFHSDIDQLDYQQVVMKWRYEMEQAEIAASKPGVYFSELKSEYQRKVELVVSVLPKWKQMILTDSYFEHFTLPMLLSPFHQVVHIPEHKRDGLIQSYRYYSGDISQSAQVHSRVISVVPSSFKLFSPTPEYYHQEMIIPKEIEYFVLNANIPVKTNSDGQLVMIYGDALAWILSDYVRYLSETKINSFRSEIDARKIVHYFAVIKQSKLPANDSDMANSIDAQCQERIDNKYYADISMMVLIGMFSFLFGALYCACITACLKSKSK